jgi:glycosyltransferase involved in cell wall biosynthesis
MPSIPKVSVVMSAYNAAAYLGESVGSILDQTFRDFEFVIINNGSSDDTGPILDRYQKMDARIRVYYHEQQGLAPALNFGCRLARGQYIALMDADDFSLPHRLARQVEYMEKHPQIGIVGSWIHKLKNGELAGSWCPSTSSKMLKWSLFFGICVCFPSVMIRRELVDRVSWFYRTDLYYAEDVDLCLRLSSIAEFGNIPEVLYRYRVWQGSSTQTRLQSVREAHVRLLTSFIGEFLRINPPVEAVTGLRQTRVGPLFSDPKTICLTAALIQDLYRQFLKKYDLTAEERREITWDAARRLASLALQASRFDTLAFIRLFIQAMKLDHRLLYPAAVARGVDRHRSFAVGDDY